MHLQGNIARFINHSCAPNCETQLWEVGGVTRVGLFCRAPGGIAPGTEITYDYQVRADTGVGTRDIYPSPSPLAPRPMRAQFFSADTAACRCGAATCRGTLGSEKRPAAAPPPPPSSGGRGGKRGGRGGRKGKAAGRRKSVGSTAAAGAGTSGGGGGGGGRGSWSVADAKRLLGGKPMSRAERAAARAMADEWQAFGDEEGEGQ